MCQCFSHGDTQLWWRDESILSDRVQDRNMVSHLTNSSISCYTVDILLRETIIAITSHTDELNSSQTHSVPVVLDESENPDIKTQLIITVMKS